LIVDEIGETQKRRFQMSMSKQHYTAIANHFFRQHDKAVKELNRKELTHQEYALITNTLFAIASGMAADFSNDNARFDRTRFLSACGFGV
jgi:hypothetical protein